jgi:hypothetical protein
MVCQPGSCSGRDERVWPACTWPRWWVPLDFSSWSAPRFRSLVVQVCSFSWASASCFLSVHATFPGRMHLVACRCTTRLLSRIGAKLQSIMRELVLFFLFLHSLGAAFVGSMFFSTWCTASSLHLCAQRLWPCIAKRSIFYQSLSELVRHFRSLFCLCNVHVFVGLEGRFCAFYVLVGSIGASLRCM